MKKSIVAILVMFSASAFASAQLTCNVSEQVNPPLQARSVNYVLTAPLASTDSGARIDATAQSLNLKYGFETFRDSSGKQIVLIGVGEATNKNYSTAYGANSTRILFDTNAGTLSVDCSVQ